MSRPLLFLVVVAIAFGGVSRGAAATLSFPVVDQKSQPVADAVVSLIPLDAPPPPPAGPLPSPEIDQRGQEFSPFVTVVRTGTSIHFPNRDTVEHYVYSESEPKRFQLPLYAPGKNETILFDRPGVVALGCNIHDWMLAYVVVVDTPWFAQTGADGRGVVRAVPPGRYRVEIWHPRLRTVATREISVGSAANGGGVYPFSLTLRPDHRIRRPVEVPRGGYR